MKSDTRDKHVVDCESALECWSSRRINDFRGHVIPRQNIQPILARYDTLLNCLYYMETNFNVDFSKYKILDVGSASGTGLIPFLTAGFSMDQLNGIDLFKERVNLGKEKYPGLNLSIGDATEMSLFSDGQFDMVMEQFCFCHIDDNDVIAKIAKQMMRVVKPDGFILVMDWIIGRKKARYNGVPRKKIEALFPEAKTVVTFPSQLAPPLGRLLSRYLPSLYPGVRAAFPFLALSRLTLLKMR